MNLRPRAALGLWIALIATTTHAGETVERPPLDRTAVSSLVNAPDVAALEKAYKDLRPNAGLEILYRSLRLRMQPGATNELAFLGTVPRTLDDYRLYRAIDDPAMGTEMLGVLSSVVNGYFESLARLSVKNHVGLQPYLRLHSMTDGYARTDSQRWLDWLFRHDRDGFVPAFRSLDATAKRAICGEDCRQYEGD